MDYDSIDHILQQDLQDIQDMYASGSMTLAERNQAIKDAESNAREMLRADPFERDEL